MVSLDRRHAAIVCLLAAGALHGCAFERRDIVVDDASTSPPPDARDERPDAAPLDAPDGTVAPDVVDAVVTPDAPERDVFDATPDEAIADVVAPADRVDELVACAPGRVLCGLECVDLTTDTAHCGGCGVRCTGSQSCVAGRCVAGTRAGALCTMPDLMGGVDTAACGATLRCLPTNTTPWCSLECVDNASQVTERAMCGGGSSTCLTIDEGMFANSRCTQACVPGAAAGGSGACRAGYICTGWWFTRASGRSDATGCAPFCQRDVDCPAGLRCNVRLGTCGMRAIDPTRLPDSAPCDPTVTELPPGETFRRNTQCRGECFPIDGAVPSHGICGSYVNLSASRRCPDDPGNMMPETSATPDDYALCVVRTCAHNSDCRAPLICRYEEGPPGTLDRTAPPECLYATNAQRTGIP